MNKSQVDYERTVTGVRYRAPCRANTSRRALRLIPSTTVVCGIVRDGTSHAFIGQQIEISRTTFGTTFA